MKIMWKTKDGGPKSRVYAWGIEIKGLCSVLLMKFESGSRPAYHSHAFNAVSWVLRGGLREYLINHALDEGVNQYLPSLRPIITGRETTHQVHGLRSRGTWVLTFRGPWVDTWREVTAGGAYKLTHGRKEI